MNPPLRRTLPALAAALVLILATGVTPVDAAKKKAVPEGGPGGGEGKKSFAEIVKNHEKLDGLFTAYRNPEHFYLDIPQEWIGKPFGLAGLMVKALGDWSVRGGSIENQVVMFRKVGDRIVLAKQNLDYRAESGSPFRIAVDSTFPDSPVFSAKIIPTSETRSAFVVDLGGVFSPSLMETLSPRTGYAPSAEDSSIAEVHNHPDDLTVRIAYRFNRREQGGDEGPEQRAGRGRPLASRLPDPRYLEALVDYTFFRLPDNGFRPRPADERIGGFDTGYKDYTGVDHRDTAFRYLFLKWGLEKKDPDAALSAPKEPIVFYVDKATPPEWRGRVKEAALWWNKSFEKVGFKDALQVLDQPDDPTWDPTDIHHSMIYWNLSDNLMFSGLAGPQVIDPRTGQVLKANAYLNGEFPSYTLHRYLVYAWWRAPQWEHLMDPFALPATGSSSLASRVLELDARRSGSPAGCDYQASFSSQIAFARLVLQARGELGTDPQSSERFAREAFAELTAHEVGHALGFSHNFKASLISKPADLAAGTVSGHPDQRPFGASIMDYNPIYLAPKGASQKDFFMQGVGPYDDLMLEYIYRPFPKLAPAQEAAALDEIARKAETTPGLMFDDGSLSDIDPASSTDDLGDDPLAFAESRLVMLQDEVLPRIGDLVVKEGHDFNRIRQALDAAIFSVALDYIDLTTRYVGGQSVRRIVARSGGPPSASPVVPIEPAQQRRALAILDKQLFDTQAFPVSEQLLAQLKPDFQYDWNYPYRYYTDYSFDSRVAFLYDSALQSLLDSRRLARIVDNQRRQPHETAPLTLPELFGHLTTTAFAGMDKVGTARATVARPSVSPRSRSLQRLTVSRLTDLLLEPRPGAPAEATQVARATLVEIRSRVRRITGNPQRLSALDDYSRAHFQDLDAVITRALEAKVDLKRAS
ncbi:MAG TPA: zinc-dependent metalloprotease [Candidatus Polarisedimenticolia bacterium]|nr:zinc-dependent metalloprotease [Candidatus Polarisedimenticolia bacterium]